jgi:hypothetical protein
MDAEEPTPLPDVPAKDSIRQDDKLFGGGGKLHEHPTEQHMITYTLSDDQLDFIETGGLRFTILSMVSAFLWSATLSCFLSGMTVTSAWTAAQYAAFRVAPLFSLALAIAASLWAKREYTAAEKRKDRIKKRSFEPGTPKTLEELRDTENV